MKPIENYLNEAFVTKSNIKKAVDANTDNRIQPQNKQELQKIINERIHDNMSADLNDIDTSKITDMSGLFKNRLHFNGNISQWDVSNVSNMNDMFRECINFDGDLGDWDIHSLETCKGMFCECRDFTGVGLEKWAKRMKFILNTDSKNALSMFYQCKNLEGKNLECWKEPKPVIGNFMFEYCPSKPSWYRTSSIK